MLLHINSTITNINEVVRDFAGKIISVHHGRELFAAGKLSQAAHSFTYISLTQRIPDCPEQLALLYGGERHVVKYLQVYYCATAADTFSRKVFVGGLLQNIDKGTCNASVLSYT